MSDDQATTPVVASQEDGGANNPASSVGKSDTELFEIAQGINRGSIFTSAQVREQHMMHMVFFPLALIDKKQAEEMKALDIAVVYAPMNEALPRGVNGYPMFRSCKMLSRKDWQRTLKFLKQIEEALSAIAPKKSTGEEHAELDAVHAERQEGREAAE